MRTGAVLLAALLTGAAGSASAEVTIRKVGWQLALQIDRNKRVFHDIQRWLFPPSPKMRLRPRAVVVLANGGKAPESAVLLRYAFTARLRRIGEESEGTWTVPFLVEEKRVTKIDGSSTKEVYLPLNRVALRTYLTRMYRSGFWPDSFRVRVMVEPRPGETFRDRVVEMELPAVWNAASMKEPAQ